MTVVPKCAVLLAAYNGMEWIRDQIESILNQEKVEVDIFVSVDLSSDGTNDFICALSKRNARVTMLSYGEKFGGAAPNFYRLFKDVSFDSFDIVALSDQDDIWHPNKLYSAWSDIQSNKYDVVSSNVTAFWVNNKTKLIVKSYPQKKYDYYFESAGPGCTYVLRASIANEFKKFLFNNFSSCKNIELHDWLIYAFCRHNGFNWLIQNISHVDYRQHSSNQFGTNSGIKAYLDRLSRFRSGWYREQSMKIFQILNADGQVRYFNRLYIIFHVSSCRRNPRDQLILFILVMVGIF